MAIDKSLEIIINNIKEQRIWDEIGDPISIQDINFKIIYQNQRHRDIIGDRVGEFCYHAVHGRDQVCTRCHLAMSFEDGKSHTFEQTRTTDDCTKYYEITASPIKDMAGNIIAGIEVVRDISRRKKKHEKLKEAALTDGLTGLFNRRGFLTLAEQQRKFTNRSKKKMSLIYIDIDGMKTINDELGHNAGDQALMDSADILRESFRESDIIARIGGDEFAVLLSDPSGQEVEHVIVNHIENSLKFYNETRKRDYELLFSMGIAHYDSGYPCSIDDLIIQADELMYEDKRLHKIESHIYPLPEQQIVEKRSFQRFRTEDCHTKLDTLGRIGVKDISLGGLCVKTPERLTTKRALRISDICDSNGSTALLGVVIWSSHLNAETKNLEASSQFEAGLKFIGLNDGQRQILSSIISSFSA
jgi:diguanylate cyclase (GGDEF)-like protein